jgi:hypothetical protein
MKICMAILGIVVMSDALEAQEAHGAFILHPLRIA